MVLRNIVLSVYHSRNVLSEETGCFLAATNKMYFNTPSASDATSQDRNFNLGEAVQYESHPELAVKGSWTIECLRKELARLRAMGLEPIPKLNFSTGHDAWLKEYERQVSTPIFYKKERKEHKNLGGVLPAESPQRVVFFSGFARR